MVSSDKVFATDNHLNSIESFLQLVFVAIVVKIEFLNTSGTPLIRHNSKKFDY